MASRRRLAALAAAHLRPRASAAAHSSLYKPLALPSRPQNRSFSPLPSLSVPLRLRSARFFSSRTSDVEDEDEYEDEDEDEDEEEDAAVKCEVRRGKTAEEMATEAAEIGYRVVGPLGADERPFKPYEPVFAVVQIGSHQFKVSNRDSIFTEKLKFCEVNDKLILNRVLMLGSRAETIIGRPVLPDAAVHAVVEEHALDAKVIIFKKKRRKNYRRTKGHRQELTKLRITDIQGIDKSDNVAIAA